ncbi:hypothetical protein DQ384_31435 [Sphaerisporangium album]|uniref:Uncharacterized protein n=1 Tax=Sphaerisporangium album TaxID=509200 RepID=A0A367F517_9ACTN|nr:hypothetical protein DQ384_31435 [Sphaerisporangium album]
MLSRQRARCTTTPSTVILGVRPPVSTVTGFSAGTASARCTCEGSSPLYRRSLRPATVTAVPSASMVTSAIGTVRERGLSEYPPTSTPTPGISGSRNLLRRRDTTAAMPAGSNTSTRRRSKSARSVSPSGCRRVTAPAL